MFKLKHINEKTFGLDLMDATTNKNDNNNNNNNVEIKSDSIDSSPKSIPTNSIGRLKSKLKLFETNFEVKFTKEESK